jgi:hypothetical protein
MTYDELSQILESEAPFGNNLRATLRKYLLEQLVECEREPSKGEEIAYGITGLLGAKSVMRLAEDDPYREILQLAGDLELPPSHRDSNSTWERFAALVRALPEN